MIARDLFSESSEHSLLLRGRLVQAAGVTDGGGGLGLSAHDVTAQDSLGDFGRVLRWRDACQGL